MLSKQYKLPREEYVAGNGLLHRRTFLTSSIAFFSVASSSLVPNKLIGQENYPVSMLLPGAPLSGYGLRSKFESHVQRYVGTTAGTTGAGSSRTPLEKLSGIITPNGLHFERHHSGIPDIDPEQHQLLIHGLVDRPLVFDINTLLKYPMVSRTQYIECSGNSRPNLASTAPDLNCGQIHGMISCCEWTGIPISVLLQEAGIKSNAKWVLAEGADAAAMTRSIPLSKAMDDTMIALFQNGEALRPENGYPIRVILPGYEGNISVKWLRRLMLSDTPIMTKDETSKYTDLQKDGRSEIFTLEMGVKSVITSPSGGQFMQHRGIYEIKGLAWSGTSKIKRVDVSADGGLTWAEAMLSNPILSKSLTQFRLPWDWNGQHAIIMSRAIDEDGNVQPTRDAFIDEKGLQVNYHNNIIQSWKVSSQGEITNTYV